MLAAIGAVELVDIEEFPTIYAEKHTIIVISLSILSRMKFVLWARTNLLIISQPKGRPSGSNKPPYLVAAQGARPSGSNEPPDPVTAQGHPPGLNENLLTLSPPKGEPFGLEQTSLPCRTIHFGRHHFSFSTRWCLSTHLKPKHYIEIKQSPCEKVWTMKSRLLGVFLCNSLETLRYPLIQQPL